MSSIPEAKASSAANSIANTVIKTVLNVIDEESRWNALYALIRQDDAEVAAAATEILANAIEKPDPASPYKYDVSSCAEAVVEAVLKNRDGAFDDEEADDSEHKERGTGNKLNEKLHLHGVKVLALLTLQKKDAPDDKNRGLLFDEDAQSAVVGCMKSFPSHPHILQWACYSIQALAKDKYAKKELLAEGAVEALHTMKTSIPNMPRSLQTDVDKCLTLLS